MIYNKNEREFINIINNSYYLKDVVKKMGCSLNNKTIKKIFRNGNFMRRRLI